MTIKIESSIPLKLKDFVKLEGIASSKRVFKNGSIELNGRKIQVSSNDNLESLASKINVKSYATKIEAVVISNGSQEKLLLKSKKSEVNLVDFSGIFESLYKDEKFGVNKNSLIQVIRDSSYIKPSNVSLNYYVSSKKQPSLNAHILGELNKFELSRYTTNNEIDNAPKLAHASKTSMPVALAPIAIPIVKIDTTPIENIKKTRMDNISKYIINGAILEAAREKKLNEPLDVLKQKLVDELGKELSSKYERLSINDFNLKSIPLIDTISKRIANSHESSWMRIPFSTEELKISDVNIANIRVWIKDFA